jgi:hypothetical protein
LKVDVLMKKEMMKVMFDSLFTVFSIAVQVLLPCCFHFKITSYVNSEKPAE